MGGGHGTRIPQEEERTGGKSRIRNLHLGTKARRHREPKAGMHSDVSRKQGDKISPKGPLKLKKTSLTTLK